jgi:hypothetical protein
MLEENYLSGHKFSKIADYVFATEIKNSGQKKHIFYPLNINLLENNETVYCKTDYINDFFALVKNINKKINLITHESDYSITKNIFNTKPNCIKKWYAINVEYDHPDLIPIPLGLANDYCQITLKFGDLNLQRKQKKLLYINHRIETNRNSREWVYNYFENNDWCTVKKANLSFEEYKKDLSEHKFMLCPKGNGIDTHRLWECLYAGIIPIVENHINYKNMHDLPILFVDSFKQIDKNILECFNSDNKNLTKLNINHWKKEINNEWSN